jgi:hypothetical protein
MKTHQLPKEEILAIFKAFLVEIKPAEIKDTEENGRLLMAYVQQYGLDVSVESFTRAAYSLRDHLTWAVPLPTGPRVTAQPLPVTPPPVPVKSEAEILGERLLAERQREMKQRFGSDRGRENHAIDRAAENVKKQHEARKALEQAAQAEAKQIVEKMIQEGSITYVNGMLSRHQSEQRALKFQQKLVKRQHMSPNGKTFTQTTDWVASIPVIADAVDPDAKYVRASRTGERFGPRQW